VDQIQLPPFRVRGPKRAGMPLKAMAEFAGSYEPAPGFAYTVRADSGLLLVRGPSWPGEVAFFPMSESRLFAMAGDAEMEFFRDASGAVSHLIVNDAGREIRMARK
jgi:hypothetical protein